MIPLWQVTTAHGITTLARDGVNWHDAPLPRRWHRCRAQTIGVLDDGVRIDRCACGATGIDGGWTGRNERRRRAVREAHGRLHIDWPAGCGPTPTETHLVSGEVMAGWVDTVNALRAEKAWLRGLLSRAMSALHGATTGLSAVAAAADSATYSSEAEDIRMALEAGPPKGAP